MIQSIIKRDGRVVLYDQNKIAAAILKASARVQQRRQDPSYRAREAELQRVRRARQRDANVIQMRKG